MIKILLLSSNPKDTSNLRVSEEFRNIKDSISRAKHRDSFELFQGEAVRPQDLRRLILDKSPHIVHFSGHGEEDGIYLENQQGYSQLVKGKDLEEIFSLFKSINCIILNSCYSESQAKHLTKVIPFVIGMRKPIEDQDAIYFSIGFYDAIAAQRSVEDAFKFATNAIKITKTEKVRNRSLDINEKIKKKDVPVLIKGDIRRKLPKEKSNNNFKPSIRKKNKIKKNIIKFLFFVSIFPVIFFSFEIYKEYSYKKKISSIGSDFNKYRDNYKVLVRTNESFLSNSYTKNKLKEKIPLLINSLKNINNDEINRSYFIIKQEIIHELYLIQSGLYAKEFILNKNNKKRTESINYAMLSIKHGGKLINILEGVKYNEKVLKDNKINRSLYNIATAYSILSKIKDEKYNNKLFSTLDKIPSAFKERNPAINNPFIDSYQKESP